MDFSLVNLVSIWCIFVRYSATVFKLEKVLNNSTIPMVNDNVVFKNSLVFKAVSIKTDNSMKDLLDFPWGAFFQSTVWRCFQCIQEDYRAIVTLPRIHTYHMPHTQASISILNRKKYISRLAYHPCISECGRIKKRSKEPFLLWIQDKRIIQKCRLCGEKIWMAFYHFSPGSPTAIPNYTFNHN